MSFIKLNIKYFIESLILILMISCGGYSHPIFNRNIAENEMTDGNVVFIKPDKTECSCEYLDDHYAIKITHPQDSLTNIVLFSDVLEWYQSLEIKNNIDYFKEYYLKDYNVENEIETEKKLSNAELHTYKANISKGNTKLIAELCITYNEKENKKCVVESIHNLTDNTVQEIIKSIRYK